MVEILKCTLERVRDLTLQQLPKGDLGPERIKRLFEAWEAYWQHSGDPQAPHAVLQSGLHSDVYFNSPMALRKATVAEIIAEQLAAKLARANNGSQYTLNENSWVIGPSYGAIALVHALRARLGCYGEVTEKQPDKTQLWSRLTIPAGATLQLVEDVTTTGESLLAARDAVYKGNPLHFVQMSHVGVIVNRSGREVISGFPIVSLISVTPHAWKADECPLCKGGSRAIDKVKQHWAELTRTE